MVYVARRLALSSRMISSGGLAITRLTKSWRGTVVLDHLDLQVPPHEWTSLVDLILPSAACAALRACITGRFRAGPGSILWQGKPIEQLRGEFAPVAEIAVDAPELPNQRLQSALETELKRRRVPREERTDRATEALHAVGLNPRIHRKDLDELGRWYASLARAVACKAPLWLVDGAPDEAALHLLRSLKTSETTVLAMGLPPEPMLALSQRVGLISQGRLSQFAPPAVVYRRPVATDLAVALGRVNKLIGTVAECAAGEALIHTPLGQWRGVIAGEEAEFPPGAAVTALIRPEAIHLEAYPPEENCVAGRVATVAYRGAYAHYGFAVDQVEPAYVLEVFVANPRGITAPAPEQAPYAWVAPEDVTIVPG